MSCRWLLLPVVSFWLPTASFAETTIYSYDELGRLLSVGHSGGVNNGLATTYTFDAAGNRQNVTTSGGSRNQASQFGGVVVVPLNGFTQIPLPWPL